MAMNTKENIAQGQKAEELAFKANSLLHGNGLLVPFIDSNTLSIIRKQNVKLEIADRIMKNNITVVASS